MNRYLKIPTLFFGFIFFAQVAKGAGAPPPPPTGGSTPPCWPPPCIPIDGGITLLAVAGAAFAGKKLYENRKKQSGETEL